MYINILYTRKYCSAILPRMHWFTVILVGSVYQTPSVSTFSGKYVYIKYSFKMCLLIDKSYLFQYSLKSILLKLHKYLVLVAFVN